MDEKEIESLVRQLKAQGLTEEEIMDTYYDAFKEGKMDRADLEVLANNLGYELDDDFKNDEHADPIADKGEGAEGGISEEEAEELKTVKPDETKEEFKEKVEDVINKEDADSDDEEESEESEESEWEEANKYFKVD